jgi:imidazoleglycerol-phosphate dehydratase
MSKRQANIERKTKETRIALKIDLDGEGRVEAATGVGFLDHMLDHLGRHGLFNLKVQAKGDLHVDAHHTVEDVAICLGQAIDQALGDKAGIYRYGCFTVPMEETLAEVVLDLSGRPLLIYNVKYPGEKIGGFDVELVGEFLRALSNNAKMNLHVNVPYGDNNHHIAEAVFKALGKALCMAVALDPRRKGVPSTKGTL